MHETLHQNPPPLEDHESTAETVEQLLELVADAEAAGRDPNLLMEIRHSLSASRHVGIKNYEAVLQAATGATLDGFKNDIKAALEAGELEAVNEFLDSLYEEAKALSDDPEYQMSTEATKSVGSSYAVMARSADALLDQAA